MTTDEIIKLICTHAKEIGPYEPLLNHMFYPTTGITKFAVYPEEKAATTAAVKKASIYVAYETSANFVELTYSDGNKKLCRLENDFVFNELLPMLDGQQIAGEDTFLRPGYNSVSNESWDNLSLYTHKIIEHYKIIHKKIGENIKACLARLDPEKNQCISLIDIGTGFGNCLDKVATMLGEDGRRIIKAIGIDKNEKNIETAKSLNPSHQFEVCDLTHLGGFIKRNITDENSIVVVTSSGSLTAFVIDTVLTVLKVLQEAYRVKRVILSLAGENEVFISKYIAKQIGFDVRLDSWERREHNQIEWQTIYTLSHAVVPRIPKIENKQLTLRMHGDPLQVIATYSAVQRNTIETLDIGLAYIKEGEIAILLDKLPSLKQIFISGIEAYSNPLQLLAKQKNISVILVSSDYINEVSQKQDIKKYSKNFYDRYERMLIPVKQDISGLQRESRHKKYQRNVEETKQAWVAALLELVWKENDDVAEFVLAENLMKFDRASEMKVNRKTNYAYTIPHLQNVHDLETSLLCWASLYQKGYPVLPQLNKVKSIIYTNEKESMSFTQDSFWSSTTSISQIPDTLETNNEVEKLRQLVRS